MVQTFMKANIPSNLPDMLSRRGQAEPWFPKFEMHTEGLGVTLLRL